MRSSQREALAVQAGMPAPRTAVLALPPRSFFLLFCFLHVPLALLLSRFQVASTIHAVTTLLLGIWWAGSGRLDRAARVAAYIVGAEVIWRMTGARVYWEFGKYAIAAVFLVAILRRGRLRCPPFALLYLALLFPSTLLTLEALDPSSARSAISFDLSGPIALALAAWFFSRQTMTETQITHLIRAMIAPIITVGTLVVIGVTEASALSFGDESNRNLSGGFGPNQVSAVLGMGALIAFLCSQRSGGRSGRTVMSILVLVFATQSALTFSRGGLYAAAGGALASLFFLIRDRWARRRAIGLFVACVLLGGYVVLPRLDTWTGGALSTRFRDTGLTHRDDIARSDLQTWLAHPLLGVGPGMSSRYRPDYLHGDAPHTEFSRLFSEHGTLGLAALVMLVFFGARNVWRQPSIVGKATVAAMVTWSFLFMAANAMRLAAPSFAFGLGFATVFADGAALPFRRRGAVQQRMAAAPSRIR